MVVAPAELVEVALQPAAGDLLVVPPDAGLEAPEEPFDGVRVGVRHVQHEKYVDATQNFVVKAWNLRNDREEQEL